MHKHEGKLHEAQELLVRSAPKKNTLCGKAHPVRKVRRFK